MKLISIARPSPLHRPLELRLDFLDSVRVEKIAQIFLAEELAEKAAVERQRLRSALGERRIAFVEVGGDVGVGE